MRRSYDEHGAHQGWSGGPGTLALLAIGYTIAGAALLGLAIVVIAWPWLARTHPKLAQS